jgi:hypothetical protein
MSLKNILTNIALLFFFSASSYAQTTPPSDIQLDELRVWLKANWYDGYHNQLGYNEARRQMYGFVDNFDGIISCVYTGFTQEGGYVTYPNPINAEHIVPQSFFGSSEPMKSDIYILKPCHGNANSARSNYPYGEVSDSQAQWYGVVNNIYTSQSNMPSNADEWSERSGNVWEPQEEFKGDVARAVFYFYTMYSSAVGPISQMGSIETLYQWHLEDPADPEEISRNDKIEAEQGNRNPYIDYPGLVYEAWFWEEAAVDTDSPTITGASSVTLYCEEYPTSEIFITATDESPPLDITYTDSGTAGCDSEITRIYTVTDAVGNTSTYLQVIQLVDNQAPIFIDVPEDLVLECGDDISNLGEPVATDNCSEVTITTSSTQLGGPCPVGYQIVRMFTAIDDCGNTTTTSQTIIINATTNPVGCAADLDNDGFITVSDILLLLGEFGCSESCSYDLDNDGVIGVSDILSILAVFGTEC